LLNKNCVVFVDVKWGIVDFLKVAI
jgi:hypothetical protein